LRNIGAVAGIAFFPGLIRGAANVIQSLYPLRPNGLFLIFFIAAFSFAWQLTATSSLLVARLRGKNTRLGEHIAIGLKAMPKVLISHAVILGVVFFSYLIALGTGEVNPAVRGILATSFVVGFFLTWAPAFVAGENFSQVVQEEDDDEEEADPYEDEPLLPRSRKFQRVFSGMGVLDLGIERSFQFTMRHFNLTIAIVLLTWCSKIFPAAIAAGLFASSSDLSSILCEAALSSLLTGVVLTAAGYVFLQMLPREARDELSLPDRMPGEVSQSAGTFVSRLILSVLLVLSLLSTTFLFGVLRTEQLFPPDLKPSIFNVERNGEGVTIRFNLNDEATGYRWLDLERFRLQIQKPESTPEEKAKAEAEPKKGGFLEYLEENLAAPPSVALLAPDQYLLYAEDGKLLDERYFKPYRGKLRVELSFDLDRKKAEEPKLTYLNLDQSVQLIAPLMIPDSIRPDSPNRPGGEQHP